MDEALPRPPRRWTATVVLLVAVAFANAVALAVAWQDRSWFALGVAVYFGPILNLLLALSSLAAIPRLRRGAGFPTAWHVALSLLVPAAAIGLDFAVITAMPLRGC